MSPLISFARLFVFIYDHLFLSQSGDFVAEEATPPIVDSLIELLQNHENVTVEDVVHFLFQQQAAFGNFPLMNTLLSISTSSSFAKREIIHYDLTQALPFICIFCVFAMFMIIFLIKLLFGRNQMNANARRKPDQKKIRRLLICLEEFKKILSANDFGDVLMYDKASSENSASTDDDAFEEKTIYLPSPGCPLNNKTNSRREISAACAICLSFYKEGECVVWSSNRDCSHAFHYNCMVKWILKKPPPFCPCCRQNFVDRAIYKCYKNE